MNKLLIVLLAVCLFSVVSAHAFVKRDAPSADDSIKTQLDAVKTEIATIGKEVQDQLNKLANPDQLKKTLNDFIDAAKKMAQNFNPATTEAPK